MAGLSLGHMLVDGYATFATPLLNTLAVTLDVSYRSVSLLVGLNSAWAAVANVIVGLTADRWKHLARPTMLISAAVTVLAMSLVGVIPSYPLLAVVMCLGMLGCGAYHPPAFVAAGEASHPHRHRGVSVVMATGIAACGLGPVFASQVVARAGLKATPWCALPGLALVAVAAFLLRSQARTDHVEAERIASRDTDLRTGDAALKWLVLLFANTALRAYALIGLIVIVSHLAEREWGLGVAASGWGIGALQVGSGLGGLLGARFTTTGLERRTLLACLPMSLILLVPMALTRGTGCFLWFFAYGLALNAPAPVVIGLAQRFAPHRRALVSGLLVGPTFAVAASLASLTTPALVETLGQAKTMAFLSIPLVLSGVTGWLLPKNTSSAWQHAPGGTPTSQGGPT